MRGTAHVCVCGDHAWTNLSRGYVTLVSPDKRPLLEIWKWSMHCGKDGTPYAARNQRVLVDGVRRTFTVRLHNTLCPVPSGYLVDHESRNTLDNRDGNLRAATPSQNLTNRRRTRGSSQYRGVSLQNDMWRASITVNGQSLYLGAYLTELQAAVIYDSAAMLHHGEFAQLNFPPETAMP